MLKINSDTRVVFNNKGQTMVEYVIIIAFIAMVVYGTLLIFGPRLMDAYQNIVGRF